jgi:hypothetical protein
MNYWWVNHKQTFRQEFGGKYVWCPKKKKSKNSPEGITNHFYETVREVQPGDLVLSYANAAIQGFGFATTHCYSCPQPNEFGKVGDAWDLKGWRVDVNFQKFPSPLRTADHNESIAPLLPKRYSPIRANGFGNQGAYFAKISRELALCIAEIGDHTLWQALTSVAEDISDQLIEVALPAIQDWEDQQQHKIEHSLEIPETTRKALVQARVGQGKFKQRVANYERSCRISRVDNPTHLIASHIKPWRESDNEERLAGGNGLLLTPSIDHLFDRGFISFEDNGDLITSPVADTCSLDRMGVQPTNVGCFNIDQKYFLDYHRKEILLKSAS